MMKILFASGNLMVMIKSDHMYFVSDIKTNFIDENNIDEDEIRTFIQG